MEHQQGPTIWYMELYSMFCSILDGREVWGRTDKRVCIAEALCCPPETITILLIDYMPIQNKKFNNKKKKLRPREPG